MAKNSFVLYKSQCEILLNLSDLEMGVFFRNIINYQLNDSIPNTTTIHEKMIYDLFINQMEIDSAKYEITCKNKSGNGKLGGIKSGQVRAEKAKLKQTKQTKQTKQNEPDNVNENVNENENENDFIDPPFTEEELADLEKPF